MNDPHLETFRLALHNQQRLYQLRDWRMANHMKQAKQIEAPSPQQQHQVQQQQQRSPSCPTSMPESPGTNPPGTLTIVASPSSATTSGSHDKSRQAPTVMTSSSSSALPATHKTSSSSATTSSSSSSSVQPPGVASLNGATALTSSSPAHSRHGDSPSPPSSLGGANGGNNGCPPPTTNGGGMSNGTGGGRTSRESAAAPSGGAPGSARQLSKVKRFLTTLQQFGSDISVEAGERVRNLILNLMNGTLTIDEFHHKLQETTNFPLRPFVIPFLKANLPLLQREIVHCARLTKQSPQQYLHQHEHLILDAAHSPHDPPDLFSSSHPSSDLNENGKRRNPDRHSENGNIDSSLDLGPPLKRHHPLMSPPLGHPTSSSSMGMHGSSIPMRMDDYGPRDYRDRERALNLDREFRHYGFTTPRDLLDDRETEEEWKNIHTMLNCILGMVEKTKRALAILQHRSQTDRQELAMWVRRHAEGAENNLKKHAGDMMAQTLKTTEDRVSEVKRRAEEAVNEVKRQAVVELQKAVATAEVKARELVTSERGKMEKLIMDARRQAAEEAAIALNQQADSNEACWNCGRKASETCSGCNAARYCGSFCQHKDWENHHHSCGQNQTASVSSSAGKSGVATSGSIASGKPSGHGQSSSSSSSSSSAQPTSATGSTLISSSSGGGSSSVAMATGRSHSNNPAYSLSSSSTSAAASGGSNPNPRTGGGSAQQSSSNQSSELKSHLESKR